MTYASFTNDLFFNLISDYGLNFLLDGSYYNKTEFAIQNDDIIVFKNYFEERKTFDHVENLVEVEKLNIVYFPRSVKNKDSYAFITKSKFVFNKLNDYINLYKLKITAIYDFQNYWDCQWKVTIMCERMCEKMMNDTSLMLFDTTIIPYDFVGTVQSNPRTENTLITQKQLDFSDKIICSEAITRILKKMDVKINTEKIILHPHVWGTSSRYSIEDIEDMYGYKIPFKNMCYMSNIQDPVKKENSFVGFYINKNENLPEKDKEILLWGKEMDLVLGRLDCDKKLKLIDKLCEKYKVYVTALGQFDRIKHSMVNKDNFINYEILDRNEYLNKMKEFKIFMLLNENVGESLGFIEALAAGCHIISHKSFHSSVTESADSELKNYYSIYNNIDQVEELVTNILIKNFYQSKIIDVYEKYNYINRVINIVNGFHEITGVKYF